MGLKAALYAKRKKLGRAARGKSRKSTRWLYPWATERRYATTIRAWLKPMMDYVQEYLKNNQEAILRGDSASLIRQDELPGGSYRRMVKSLYGWHATYLPPISESGTRESSPIVFAGLGNIAESMAKFNSEQWNKAARAELGVEFPVYENWWPETKQIWQEENYRLIQGLGDNYIKQVNLAASKAVTSGMSVGQLVKAIQKINTQVKTSRVNLIARDQIGKLNGQITQARMEAIGLEMYEWSTSSDERVRDSHANLEGMICRWDDPTVYSVDGGKTWKNRPSDWCQEHPGQDIQCRCTALSYWAELVNEVDREIDEMEGFSVNDPGDAKDLDLPEKHDLNKMIEEYTGREGQKIESIDVETKYIRDMGIAAGNKIEFGTFIQDGKIIQAIKGDKKHVPVSKALEERILQAPKGSVVMIHFHPSGSSFGDKDLGTLGSIKAFAEIRVTSVSDLTFSMMKKYDSIYDEAANIHKEYTRQWANVTEILKRKEGLNFDELTNSQQDNLVSRGVCQVLSSKYKWIYKEYGNDGK